ncbi:MAG: DUF4190 domain-containing protein [Thermoplasmatota archaeon]
MGKTNGLATASMVLGIIGFCVSICGPIALILGLIALSQIKKTGEEGRGNAIAGIVMGAIVTAFTILGTIFYVLMFGLAIAAG